MNLQERDKKIIWHPFTQEKTSGMPIVIKNAKGSYLFDENDKSYLDMISSWWVNLHGHSHPYIASAICEQAKKLEHVIFAGFTHEPAVKLCENLQTILPNKLERFFFSDNGSTAVEVALKMAHQYWINKGEKNRNLFLAFDGGYHGDTIGAMSVGKSSNYHNPFHNLMFDVISIPLPCTWIDDNDIEEKEEKSLYFLQSQLELSGDKISSIILEPLVQGASGMRMYRGSFIKKAINLIKKYNILVIYDEVMTGFGRTGTHFALNQIDDIIPDFLCISKGITGGFLPLSLTVTTNDIYDIFIDDNTNKAFLHGHSYTANPIACAAAIASFELLIEKNTQEKIAMINSSHIKYINKLYKLFPETVNKCRVTGTIAAFEINSKLNLNAEIKNFFLQKGVLLRPLNNTIYLIPPYSISDCDLSNVYSLIIEYLKTHS